VEYDWDERENTLLSDRYPAEFRHLAITTSDKQYLSGNKGKILLQSIRTEDFTLWFNHFIMEEACLINAITSAPIATMHFMLDGCVSGTAANFSEDSITAGTYQLFFVPPGRYRVQFAKGSCHAIRIDFSADFLKRIKGFFPQVTSLTEALESGSPSGIRLPEGHLTYREKTILEELKTIDTRRQGSDLFLHARLYELLWLYLSDIGTAEEKAASQAYFSKIREVRDYVTLNLDNELGTTILARQFGISATTLKRQFKHQYGLTIREFLVRQRMERAKELLTHSDLSVHSIGMRVGYPEFSSFTRAFTRYFGHSPSYFRK
jgi:AraC-like DNA-binding protein